MLPGKCLRGSPALCLRQGGVGVAAGWVPPGWVPPHFWPGLTGNSRESSQPASPETQGFSRRWLRIRLTGDSFSASWEPRVSEHLTWTLSGPPTVTSYTTLIHSLGLPGSNVKAERCTGAVQLELPSGPEGHPGPSPPAFRPWLYCMCWWVIFTSSISLCNDLDVLLPLILHKTREYSERKELT